MASLGHQSLPLTDLGEVDEEMASPGGRPLQTSSEPIAIEKDLYVDNLAEPDFKSIWKLTDSRSSIKYLSRQGRNTYLMVD
ncbi:hypothetical protein TNCV_4542441 [Trichonephila clavipes]|nr:hypothetical protein TNCV_4542441 [Trichonephila clavipes]